jgi:hypothetical protein
MRSLRLRLSLLCALSSALGAGFLACDLKMDSAALAARSSEPQSGPDCASCHRYVLQDSNHLFHLFQVSPSVKINGRMTCLECHATSMLSMHVADSIFLDSAGNEWHGREYPVYLDSVSMGDTIRRDFRFDHTDSVPRNVPVPAAPRAGSPPERRLTEWMTGAAHMNGRVDVVFDPRVSNLAKFRDTIINGSDTTFVGRPARYNPEQEGCSAIACHPGADHEWGFAAPSKGLPTRKF